VNIAGLYITDNLESEEFYKIPDSYSDTTLINPGGYLVLRADANTKKGVLHLDFELMSSGEQIGLAQKIGSDMIFIDTITFGGQSTDVSYGRYPDGSSSFDYFEMPTPGSANLNRDEMIIKDIYINEFVSRYGNSYPDEHGLFSDWIEIYNGGSKDIDLGGLYLSDKKSIPAKFQIPFGYPDSTTIKPGGFTVFFADSKPKLGVNHLLFELSSGGEDIVLSQIMVNDTLIIDSLSYTGLEIDESYGRVNDGIAAWRTFNIPTPGRSNSGISPVNELSLGDHGLSFKVYPNPFRESTTIQFDLFDVKEISIQILDWNSRIINVLGT